MLGFATRVLYRAICHDNSKLYPPELIIFANAPARPYDVSYGSPKYYKNLSNLSGALLHHYSHNRHHPEHYDKGIRGMSLLDLVEMVSDWQAALNSHMGTSVQEIITNSQQRFGMSDDLSAVLSNSMNSGHSPRAEE